MYFQCTFKMSCKKAFPNYKLKNKQLQNNLNKLKSNLLKTKSSRDFVKIMFSKNFIFCFLEFFGIFFAEHLFSKHFFLDTCFTVKYFFGELDSQSFNISNFINNHSQVFSQYRCSLKNMQNSQEHPVLEDVFNKVAGLQSPARIFY